MPLSKMIQIWCAVFLTAFIIQDIQGGTTGKISGIVLDAKTGEPLVGCNIVVENTQLGAATDQDGYFFIINMKPGLYTVSADVE